MGFPGTMCLWILRTDGKESQYGKNMNGFTGERRARCSTGICLFCLLRIGEDREKTLLQSVCYIDGDLTEGLGLRNRRRGDL